MLYQASAASLMSSASNLLKRVTSHASVQMSEFGAAGSNKVSSPMSGNPAQSAIKPKGGDAVFANSMALPRLSAQNIASEVAASTAFTSPGKSIHRRSIESR